MENHTNEKTTELLDMSEKAVEEARKKLSPTVMLRIDRRLRDEYKKLARDFDTTITSMANSGLSNYLKSLRNIDERITEKTNGIDTQQN